VTCSCPKTVKGNSIVCISAADVPLAVRVKLPANTVDGTDKITVWELPGATLNGEAGDVVAPGGNPASVTTTGSVNPS
jgi:hypothetical protein